MSDHAFGRRGYDDDIMRALGRVEAKVDAVLATQAHDQKRLDGALERIDEMERLHDREDGASAERTRWLGFAKAGRSVLLPAGGIAGGVAAAITVALHWWQGGVK